MKRSYPLASKLLSILKEWEFKLPELSDQKLNQHIKEVGRLAGIDEEVRVKRTIGGESIEVLKPKYKLIKSHTGRRSALTNMAVAEVPILEIMSISQHKNEDDFFRYIKISKKELAKLTSERDYFTKSRMKIV